MLLSCRAGIFNFPQSLEPIEDSIFKLQLSTLVATILYLHIVKSRGGGGVDPRRKI